MATLEIPDEVYEALAERARMNQRSVDEQARAELAGDVDEDRRRRRRMIVDNIRKSPSFLSDDAPTPENVIREIRDHDGRS